MIFTSKKVLKEELDWYKKRYSELNELLNESIKTSNTAVEHLNMSANLLEQFKIANNTLTTKFSDIERLIDEANTVGMSTELFNNKISNILQRD